MAYRPDVRVTGLAISCPHIHYLHSIIRHVSIDYSENFLYNYFNVVDSE